MINLANAKAVENGVYSRLLCPKCKEQCAEAYFSEQNIRTGYGIWFECQRCGNVEHISCSTQPGGFTSLRISEKFQQLDEQAWKTKGN